MDDGIFADLVLFEIGFEPFGTGGEDGSLDDIDHLFGVFEGQWLFQWVAVMMQNVLDWGHNCGYNSFCLQGGLLS